MDIVSRIKVFIKAQNLAVSQFADTCLIPRPTVSQLLNGRNKKVSDEIISKIHVAFPNLSINWLLFGEGEMYSSISDTFDLSEQDSDLGENPISLEGLPTGGENENVEGVNVNKNTQETDSDKRNFSDDIPKIFSASSIKKNEGEVRKVVKIIVFYSDNSYECFKS